jgi:peptidoglycan hydrolase-like protein with peptidoglycan-binding domain
MKWKGTRLQPLRKNWRMDSQRFQFRKPRRLVVGVAISVSVMVAVLWWAGTRIRSTSQAEALARPPSAAVTTIRAQEMVVRSTLTLAGSVSGGTTMPVPPPQLLGDVTPVVTRVAVMRNGRVRGGTLIADVSGRPVFVLQGNFPMYRALTEGMTGPDVAELQAGLINAGYGVFDATGKFGESTAAALRDLYAAYDYTITSSGSGSTSPSPSTSPSASTSPSPSMSASRALSAGQVPTIPVGEIVFVKSLPAIVVTVNTPVGSIQPGGAIVTLSSGHLDFHATVPAVSAGQVRLGMRAVVTVQGSQRSFAARVDSVPAAGSNSTNVTLRSAEPVPHDLAGQTAQAVVTISATSGRVLAVALAALQSEPDGSPAVGVMSHSRVILVPVKVGETGDGYVEITGETRVIRPGTLLVIPHA